MCFSDVTEAHGPTHYVNRTDSDNCGGMKRFLKKREDPEYQKELIKFERSAAGPAGTLLAYGIDVFHRDGIHQCHRPKEFLPVQLHCAQILSTLFDIQDLHVFLENVSCHHNYHYLFD